MLKGILQLALPRLNENEEFLKEVIPDAVFLVITTFLFKRLDMEIELDTEKLKPSVSLKAFAAIAKAMKKLPGLSHHELAYLDSYAAFLTAQAETLEKAEQK